MTVASADINLQRKHNVTCQVAIVKPATSAHSMADVTPFLVNSILASSPTLRSNQKKIYFIHNKENNIKIISVWGIVTKHRAGSANFFQIQLVTCFVCHVTIEPR